MSKGNMFLGYARGKVGSLVFARRKGEQITRARNVAPSNPRTNAQMTQRMKMYAPVQLYRQSMRRFFKFAFNIAVHETVFNAYMRENIALAPWASKSLSVAQAPVPFPAKMSSGSLQNIAYVKDLENLSADDPTYSIGGNDEASSVAMLIGLSSSAATLGDISAAILDSIPTLREGDQLTFVICGASGVQIENGDVLYDGISPFHFQYAKFVLNRSSERTPADAGLAWYQQSGVQDGYYLGVSAPINFVDSAVGGCVIVTRNEGSSVVASNSSLALNGVAEDLYNFMRTDAYREKAALSYKATPDAYLNPATTEV